MKTNKSSKEWSTRNYRIYCSDDQNGTGEYDASIYEILRTDATANTDSFSHIKKIADEIMYMKFGESMFFEYTVYVTNTGRNGKGIITRID